MVTHDPSKFVKVNILPEIGARRADGKVFSTRGSHGKWCNELFCEICETPFYRTDSELKLGKSKTCSVKCRSQAQRKDLSCDAFLDYKTCNRCGKSKPISDFSYKNKKKKQFQSHCKEC